MANTAYTATTSSTAMITQKVTFLYAMVTWANPITIALNETGSAVYWNGIVLYPGQPFVYDGFEQRWIENIKVISSWGSSTVALTYFNY